MTEITVSLVKELRDRTGSAMIDCKKALAETSGNMEAAIDLLRAKGLSNAAKKVNNVATEGLVSACIEGNQGVIIEINSQTDFVAMNDKFQTFIKNAIKIALKTENIEDFKNSSYTDGKTVDEELQSLSGIIGEKFEIRRMNKITSEGKVFSYVHSPISEGMGKIAVIVAFSSEGNPENIGKQIAMHIASNQPKALSIESLDPKLVEREKEVQKAKILEEGKPADIAEKMMQGRMNKFYQEVCLLEQSFVIDPDKKVSQVLKENGVSITSYNYYVLGEGIEKQEEVDFATEVAKIAGSK